MKKADIKDRNALSNKYNFQVNSIVISGNIRIIHYQVRNRVVKINKFIESFDFYA